MKLKEPKLSPSQWKLLSSATSHISQVIVVFSLGSLFVPEAVGLSQSFSRVYGIIFLIGGLLILLLALIVARKHN